MKRYCYLNVLLLAEVLLSQVWSLPFDLGLDILRPRQGFGPKLEELDKSFPGIHWAEALPSCGEEHFDVLVEATRKLYEFTNIEEDVVDETTAWHHFFVSSFKAKVGAGWTDNDRNRNAYLNIISNLKQVNQWPSKGRPDRKGKYQIWKQVTYSCTPPGSYEYKCNPKTKIAAFVAEPSITEDQHWKIIFCPAFFKYQYLNDISNGPKQGINALSGLYTYEHLLAHEFLHVNLIGIKETVYDMEGDIPGLGNNLQIYGAVRCHDWAHKDQLKGPGPVNIDTSINADNYAWYLTYRWFAKQFNWPQYVSGVWAAAMADPGAANAMDFIQRDAESKGDPNPADDKDTHDYPNVFTFPKPPGDTDYRSAPNCVQIGDNNKARVSCDFVGEPYEDYRKQEADVSKSEGGCDLSTECKQPMGNAVNPACKCTCNGSIAPLGDDRCKGFKGSTGRPPDGHTQIPPSRRDISEDMASVEGELV